MYKILVIILFCSIVLSGCEKPRGCDNNSAGLLVSVAIIPPLTFGGNSKTEVITTQDKFIVKGVVVGKKGDIVSIFSCERRVRRYGSAKKIVHSIKVGNGYRRVILVTNRVFTRVK